MAERSQEILDYFEDNGLEGAVVLEGPEFDGGIIGHTSDGRLVYGYDDIVRSLADAWGTSEEEAIDFVEYNTMRSLPYMKNPPVIVIYKDK